MTSLLIASATLPAFRANGQLLTHVQTIIGGGLDRAWAFAIAPDGAHIYVSGRAALNVIERDSITGSLSLLEVHRDGMINLERISSVAVSPDGIHVYAASTQDDSLAVFRRDRATGKLTFIRNIGGLLTSVSSVNVSPDGIHVYAAGFGSDAISIYRRDANTDSLTFIGSARDGVDGADGLDGVRILALSPDGNHVYAASSLHNTLATFSRDASTGELTFISLVQDDVDDVDGLRGVADMTLSPDGAFLYVAGRYDHALAVFSRNGTNGVLAFVELVKDGVDGVSGLNNVSAVTVASDGDYVYAASYNSNTLVVFSRNPTTGALTPVDVIYGDEDAVSGFNGVASVAVSPDGSFLYVTDGINDLLASFNRDPTNGLLTLSQVLHNEMEWLLGVSSAAVSPDGSHVYMTAEFDLLVLTRDLATGEVTFVEAQAYGENDTEVFTGGVAVAVSPDGAHVYIALGGNVDSIAVFSRDRATGEVTFVEIQADNVDGVDGLSNVAGVIVSPDGKHVYARSNVESALTVFRRNAVSGALTLVEIIRDNVNGVDGLDVVRGLAISPDGNHVYAGSRFDNAVAVFRRDGATGALTFVEAQFDGVNGVDGLYDTYEVAVSPDGAHVYAAGNGEDALAVFSRDDITGALTFVDVMRYGTYGLDNAKLVTVSPDGQHVYTTGERESTLGVFRRDSATGALTFVETQMDGVNGMEGITLSRHVALSPEGAHLYLTSAFEQAITVIEKGVIPSLCGRILDVRNLTGLNCAVLELTASDGLTVYSTQTDVNGEYFFIELPEDEYTVRLSAVGFGEFSANPIDLMNVPLLYRDYMIEPQQLDGVIQGIVTDALSDEPLVGVLVKASVDGEPVASTYTCATGKYELAVAVEVSTAVTLTFLLENYETIVVDLESQPDAVSESNQAMTRIEVHTWMLTGEVRQATDGEASLPLAGAQVTIRGPVNTSTVSLENGSYEFPEILEGTYTIRASAEGFIGQTATRNVGLGGPAAKTFTLVPEAEGSPTLSVNTALINVDAPYGSTTLTVANIGDGTLEWSAMERCHWVTPSMNTGSLGARQSTELTVTYDANPFRFARDCDITISAPNAAHSPRIVRLSQAIDPTRAILLDINNDGYVNAVDVQVVINGALGVDLSPFYSDVSEDGVTNAIDIQLVINAVLGV
jgi:6-phosphogluconolactonase (cycloisomerase 2 family)